MHEPPLRDRAAMILGGLGLVAGIASALLGTERPLDALQPLANLFLMHASLLPIGLCFAVAIGMGCWLVSRGPWHSLGAALVTLYAWSGAVHIAIRTQRNIGDEGHLVAASLAAGAFGAAVTHFGASVALPEARHWRALLVTIATGALFGLVFYAGERGLIDRRALFVVWQPAVAFVIGLAAARPISDPR
ncbi:MAG: hypothetical protein EKK41_00070 [Hyphomicrobiales bacterium]|nr:MAG: hypothetical protein EKK41_00070 [Hyphomicrobiales bacterium]